MKSLRTNPGITMGVSSRVPIDTHSSLLTDVSQRHTNALPIKLSTMRGKWVVSAHSASHSFTHFYFFCFFFHRFHQSCGRMRVRGLQTILPYLINASFIMAQTLPRPVDNNPSRCSINVIPGSTCYEVEEPFFPLWHLLDCLVGFSLYHHVKSIRAVLVK